MTLYPFTPDQYKELRQIYIGNIPFEPVDKIVAKWKALDPGPNVAGGEVFKHRWTVETSPLDKVTGFTFHSYSDGPDLISMYVDSNKNKRLDQSDEEIFSATTTLSNTNNFTKRVRDGKGTFEFILGSKKGGEGAGLEYPIIDFKGINTPSLDQDQRPVEAWYGIQYAMAEAAGLI